MPLLKINLGTLVVEAYAVAALLFEINIPGTSFLQETPLAKLFVAFLPLILTIIAKHIEGWNLVVLPTLFCSVAIPLAAVTSGLLKIILGFIVSLAVFAHFKTLKTIRIKALFKPTGSFSVGYKQYKGAKSEPIYSVFYPATKTTDKHPIFLPDTDVARKNYELITGPRKFPPRWFYDMTSLFQSKIRLLASIDAPMVSSEVLKEHTQSEKLIPVIFSHGLGGGRHNYSSLVSQLASKGYFVITMDHKEEVKEIILDIDKVAPKYLQTRVQEVRTVIDELSNFSGSIGKLFGSKLNLDMSRLTLMGHSYGGGTAYATASEDERIKNSIMVDPWLKPLEFDRLDKKLSCNVLLIQSGDWNEKYPAGQISVRNTKVMEAQRGNKTGAIYCKIPNSQHNHFSDDILLSGDTIKLFKIIDDADVAEEMYKASIKVFEDYLSVVVRKNQESQSFKDLYEGDSRFPFMIYA